MTTRAALVTPPGRSALATIQIMGPQSLSILGEIFRANQEVDYDSLSSERLLYGTIYDGEDIIDKVVVAVDGPKQTVDITCHGGPRVVQRLLMLLQRQGAEITTWQQLQPADSIAAEVTVTLGLVKTRKAVCAIAAQHPGGLTGWTRQTIETLQDGRCPLPRAKATIKELLGSYRLGRKLLNPPTVVLAGPVNTGKSTLANALAGKRQSLTADIAGTTRDWTVQLTDIEGLAVNLIDTAGRRESSDELEQHALAHADEQLAQADLILLVMEAGHCDKTQIEEQLAVLPEMADILVVINKADLVGSDNRLSNYLWVSALKESNLDQLRQEMAARFGFAHFDPAVPLVFTERQFELLTEALYAPNLDDIIENLNRLLGE